jgi:NAD(P)-dependent dehydrogenase (short-subunit alcohol dehydrogenase family)
LNRLVGKRVIVTGVSGYVGNAVAQLFHQEGGLVHGIDARSVGDATKWLTGFTQGDVGSWRQAQRLVQQVVASGGRLDVVVNAAAVLRPDDGEILATRENTWLATMRTNVLGVRNICRAAIPHLQKSRRGSIVNVASIVALRGSADSQISYTTSKGAVVAMSRELAIQLAPSIRVNTVCPGLLDRGLASELVAIPSGRSRRLRRIPMRRLGRSEDVAYAALFLASEEAGYVTGTEIIVDGGACGAFLL